MVVVTTQEAWAGLQITWIGPQVDSFVPSADNYMEKVGPNVDLEDDEDYSSDDCG